jgi:lysine/ornithine N-monooxygenase
MAYNGWKNYNTWLMYTLLTDSDVDNELSNSVREVYDEEYRNREQEVADNENLSQLPNCKTLLSEPKYIRVHALDKTADYIAERLDDILCSEGYREGEQSFLNALVESAIADIDFYEIAEALVE